MGSVGTGSRRRPTVPGPARRDDPARRRRSRPQPLVRRAARQGPDLRRGEARAPDRSLIGRMASVVTDDWGVRVECIGFSRAGRRPALSRRRRPGATCSFTCTATAKRFPPPPSTRRNSRRASGFRARRRCSPGPRPPRPSITRLRRESALWSRDTLRGSVEGAGREPPAAGASTSWRTRMGTLTDP